MARTVGIFFKILHYVTPETLKLLYYSFLFSFIFYGISVWGLTHPSTLDPLYKLQKTVVRAITFTDRDSTPLFHQLQLLKLNDIHTLNLLCSVYECKHHTPIKFFNNYFIPLFSVHHDYRTRKATKGDLFISSINTTQYGKRTAKYAGTIFWNNLDTNIRSSPSLNVFTSGLKKFYISLYSE